jgi:hypothetical protein
MPASTIPFQPAELEREVEQALTDASIYDIGSYGWVNENDADPEFIGHAMWQIDQPHIDENSLFGELPVHNRPKESEKEILTAGEDFCGMMQASRLSVGLTLLWRDHAIKDPFQEHSFFWLHHTDAFLKLAIAADRLRKLLIIACTGDMPKSYEKKSKRNRRYATPYQEAAGLLTERGFKDDRVEEPLAALPEFGLKLFSYIDRRDDIVHKIATPMAKIVRKTVTELQERYDQEQKSGFTPSDPMSWLSVPDSVEKELRQNLDTAVQELRNWYLLLIHTSNSVFQIEYWSRVLGPN